jgi:tRNA-(ms[2]io[6]A)-hydroxylase
MSVELLLKPINTFLQCSTPQSWIDEAIKPENLLRDHANGDLQA